MPRTKIRARGSRMIREARTVRCVAAPSRRVKRTKVSRMPALPSASVSTLPVASVASVRSIVFGVISRCSCAVQLATRTTRIVSLASSAESACGRAGRTTDGETYRDRRADHDAGAVGHRIGERGRHVVAGRRREPTLGEQVGHGTCLCIKCGFGSVGHDRDHHGSCSGGGRRNRRRIRGRLLGLSYARIGNEKGDTEKARSDESRDLVIIDDQRGSFLDCGTPRSYEPID
jgi:hypothetical protein